MLLENAYESLVRPARKKPLWTVGPSTQDVGYGRSVIERLIRHRDPFLFIDEITHLDLQQGTIRGRRRIDGADPLFLGHFPQAPIYPGVLQLETMGQLGLCLLPYAAAGLTRLPDDHVPRDVRALKVHHAQFLAELGPDAQLDVLAQVIEADDYTAICSGQILLGDTVVSLAVMEVYLADE